MLTGLMRGIHGVLLAALLVLAQSGASTQGRGQILPPNGDPSDVLTHSALAPCAEGVAEPSGRAERRPVRLATWNIRAARSATVDQIGAELMAMQADIVAVQEVDTRVRRTGFVDQPAALASALGYQYAFAASIKWDSGDYGLALLSRWPLAEVRRHRLDNTGARELRIVLDVTVCADGRPLRVFNHHADVRDEPRILGLAALAQIVRPELGRGVVVLGDFNDNPETPGVRSLLDAGLVDLFAQQNLNTASGGRIDYLLVDGPLAGRVSTTRVWMTGRSDHHALLADLDW